MVPVGTCLVTLNALLGVVGSVNTLARNVKEGTPVTILRNRNCKDIYYVL